MPNGCQYDSIDQDDTFEHDFRTLKDVGEMKLEMITMFAVIEYIDFNTLIS